jgi:nucleoside-triphosphatase THEP1
MIFVLSGPVQAGKTGFLKRLVAQLKMSGLSLSGYLSEAIRAEGEVKGYDLLELNSGRRVPFLRKSGLDSSAARAGHYYFLPSGLEAAREIIASAAGSDLLIIDEAGPAEIKGEGVWPGLCPQLAKTNCLLVIREKLLPDFIRLLPPPIRLLPAGEVEEIKRFILEEIKTSRLKKMPD